VRTVHVRMDIQPSAPREEGNAEQINRSMTMQ